MKRRYFAAGVGIGVLTLAGAANLTPATHGTLIGDPKIGAMACGHRISKFCKIIGVGGAGCNLLTAMRAYGTFDGYGSQTELFAVDLCPHTLLHVDAASKATPERSPIKTLAIGKCGSGGRVNAGRAAALRHRDQLNDLLTGADVVILIAGLGGGTGSGVTPILAEWSRATGAYTVVVAITPFDFGGSIRQSATALGSLLSNADQVVHFSNQAVGLELGDEATLGDVFAVQEQQISAWVQGLWLEKAVNWKKCINFNDAKNSTILWNLGYSCVVVIDATIFTVAELLHLQGGYPFRGSIEESSDGDALALQMKDVDPEHGVSWSGVMRTTLTGRRTVS